MKMLKRGFTLIEIVLTIAVGIGLIAGGFTLFNYSQIQSQVADTSRVVTAATVNIQAAYRSAQNYAGLDTEGAMIKGLLPERVFSGGAYLHPLGGEFSVSAIAPFDTFTVRLDGLDQSSCMQLFTGPTPALEVSTSDAARVSVNGHDYLSPIQVPTSACLPGGLNTGEIHIRRD